MQIGHIDLLHSLFEAVTIPVAVSQGLEATGTLGILDLAAKRKPINLRAAVERLKQTNFRYRKEIILETAVAPTASGACDAKALHNEAHGEAKTRESGSPQG